MTDLATAESAIGSGAGVTGGRADEQGASVGVWVARVLVLVAFFGLWQAAVATGVADKAFVSTPRAVAEALWELLQSKTLWFSLRTTFVEVGVAFVLSAVSGITGAVLLDHSPRLNSVLAPYLAAFNSMPRIALGPLFILWFGIGMTSKIVLATSLGFFIILLSTLAGLRNVDRDMLLMSRLFGASHGGLFLHVRLPWALPSIFAGLKLTLIYCTAGAVIGEMIAAQSGLGVLLQTFSGQFDVASVLAIIFILVSVVVLLTSMIEMLERRLLAWSAGSTAVPG